MVAKKILQPVSIAEEFVSELDSPNIAQIVSSANDIALVVDGDGIVRDVASEQGIENFGNATAWPHECSDHGSKNPQTLWIKPLSVLNDWIIIMVTLQ